AGEAKDSPLNIFLWRIGLLEKACLLILLCVSWLTAMKIMYQDIVLSTLCTGMCLAAGLVPAWIFHGLILLPHGFQAILLIAFFWAGFFGATIFLTWVLRKRWPLQEGVLPLGSDSHSLLWKLLNYIYIFHLWPLINASLVPVNMRAFAFSLLGARMGKSVMIGGKILDPSLVEIGDYSMLGEDSLLTAHSIEAGQVQLGRIVLGREVTIGVKAVILPDVHIQDRAIVAVGAVVTKGSRIGPDEVWAGIPARKIGQRQDHNHAWELKVKG
ncbi:MAG: hypothetical protein ACOC0S_06705, partial [Desulfohalobiaceae bacterium]